MTRSALLGTLVVLGAAPCLAAQGSDSTAFPGISGALLRDTLRLRVPPALKPGGRLGARLPPQLLADRWLANLRARLEQMAARAAADMRAARLSPFAARPADAEAVPEREIAEGEGLLEQYADLGLQADLRVEFRSERFRNERCTPAEILVPFSGCTARFPFPAPDPQFNVRAGGLVGERVHVNVDYNNQREFDANQNINVFYQGLDDEILQRLEVGNVSFEPPSSRFITAGIPANNFGVQFQAQLGALHFNGIFAQQKGDLVRDRVFTVGEVTSQPVEREARDLDFDAGRFFFVVDPARIPDYPAVDILTLDPASLAPDLQVSAVRVYRLRGTTGRQGLDPNLGGIPAVAIRHAGDSDQRVGPFAWELLIEGRDYYIDPSSLWLVLRNRLSADDFLAVSYVLGDGVTQVGTFPSAPRADGVPDTLELIHEPRRGPEVPTFRHELRNAYRVGGADVVRSSVQLQLLVNGRGRPLSGAETYLALLGMAQANDASAFDGYNRLFPRDRDPNDGEPLRDKFVVFPHLLPFADDQRLQPEEQNDSLYRIPAAVLFSQAPPPVFTLRLEYDEVGAGDRATMNLGGFQIREGSERLVVGGRQLVRGVDYEIVYEIGQVTFLNPDSLFRGPTEVRAQFEQRSTFDLAPTSIFGLATTYDLGARGSIDVVGMFQSERSTFTRPPLGFEPQSSFIGGINTNLSFRPDAVTRALNALPIVDTDVPSFLAVSGELAMSRPNPNQAGLAYVEEFEAEGGRFIPLGENAWQLGSAPQSISGLGQILGPLVTSLADSNAALLTWQNLIPSPEGNRAVQVFPTDIDPTLRFSGASQQVETVVYLALHSDTVGGLPDSARRFRWTLPSRGGGPRWRSVTQALSSTGLDLSTIEFLEVWVFEPTEGAGERQGVSLVFDFGQVLEDATDFSPDTIRVRAPGDTVFRGRHRVGEGVLDSERGDNGIWNASLDDVGILGDLIQGAVDAETGAEVPPFPACESALGAVANVFSWGNPRARCTRRNGFLDTEDLDGDNRLGVTVGKGDENVLRYVLPFGDERLFVRDGGDGWKLYRIPFRTDTTTEIGFPNLQQITAVRMTVVAEQPPPGRPTETVLFGLARMKLVGARWLKRSRTPIAGIHGALGQPHGEVVASVVSTENRDLGYVSPPGVIDQADRRGASFEVGQTQINERSLRLLARGLAAGERAEALLRFTTEGDRDFRNYRELRVWARGRGAGWEDDDLQFYIKAGKDENNFYMYRTPVNTASWEPEVIVQLQRWIDLRTRVEEAWLRQEAPSGAAECGGDSLAFVACDGPYLVHMRNPGTAPPDLSAVQELAVGILRVQSTAFVDQAELWVDDIRLGEVVSTTGFAGALDLRLTGADVFDASVSLSRRDDQFHQLGDAPSYVTDNAASMGFNVRLEHFLPASLGITMPLSVSHLRRSSEPFYLAGSDIRADAISGLRTPGGRSTQLQWSVRRNRRSASPWGRALLDPVSLLVTWGRDRSGTELSATQSSNRGVTLGYVNAPGEVSIEGVPGFLERLAEALPGFLRNSAWVTNMRNSRLRVNPVQIRWTSAYARSLASRSRFRVPIVNAPGDDGATVQSVTTRWSNELTLNLQPYRSLSLGGTLNSTRDLRDYGDTTTIGRLTRFASREFLGRDVGFESQRRLVTTVSVDPVLTSWLRPRFLTTSAFSLTRDPNGRRPVRLDGDTAGAFALPASFSTQRRYEIGLTLDWSQLARRAFGDGSLATAIFQRLLPSDVRRVRDRRAVFDRAGGDVPLSIQFGLGELEALRRVGNLDAGSAAEDLTRTATAGVNLPLGFRLNALYQDQARRTLSRRVRSTSVLTSRTREWPSGSLVWGWSPTIAAIRTALLHVSGQLQYRVRETGSAVPTGTTGIASVTSEARTIAPSLSMTWIEGILTSVQYSSTLTDDIANGNLNQSTRKAWNGNVSFQWRPPESMAKLPNPIRTQLRYSRETIGRCLQTSGEPTCSSISFTRREERGVQMDTDVPPNLSAGLSVSHLVTEERHFERKFSQLTFTAFIQFSFLTGEIR